MKTSTKYLNLEYAPGPVTVTSTTAWLKYHFEQEVDGDVSPRPVLDQYNVERYRQFSQELRIAGNVGTIIDFQAGDIIRAPSSTSTHLRTSMLRRLAFRFRGSPRS